MLYVIGQRCISEMEPELGIGIIKEINGNRLTISFMESHVERQYSLVSAPLKRVKFNIGEKIKNKENIEFEIKRIEENNGIFIYHGDKYSIKENDLSGTISFNSPLTKIVSGYYDKKEVFDLRYKALLMKNRILKSDVSGFIGGRIDIIPHQIYIAHEVSSRQIPRVLLADEVGLGKTIEACLIIHRLLTIQRINRVLIIVPESLIYQWFSELLRRFDLSFRIINEKYFRLFNKNNLNPFLDGQLCITGIDYLSANPKRQKEAITAGWDMVIVDEAHNIKDNSKEYIFLEKIAKKTERILLLTATPEQLGLESHFARLKILDSQRFFDFDVFKKETQNYMKIAKLIDKILKNDDLDNKEQKIIQEYLGNENNSKKPILLKDAKKNEIENLIKDLVDRYGIGRVVFRNSRKMIKGFPKRNPIIFELEFDKKIQDDILKEFKFENNLSKIKPDYNYQNDPRVKFIAELLIKNKTEKFLLICHTKEKVLAIQKGLNKISNFKASLFYEDLEIIERDKNASWFASEQGAQILICSEIGSEGRNFQFTNNIILFDLPDDPELLEQRIGRLDRIGQKKEINIYIPIVKNSSDEILAKWYDDGMNAFESYLPDGNLIFEKYSELIKNLICDSNESNISLKKIISETNKFHLKNLNTLENGRNKLLELNSFNSKQSNKILKKIDILDNDYDLEEFMHLIFDFFGIKENAIDFRTYHLTSGNIKTDAFSKINEEGITITYNREKAIKKENVYFINADHPYVSRSIDLMLGGEYGNTGIAIWFSNEKENIFLETIFVLECIAPVDLYINRFLPPTPIRILVDINYADYSEEISFEYLEKHLKNDNLFANRLINSENFIKNILPLMVEKSKQNAEKKIPLILQNSIDEMNNNLENELLRLKNLQKINNAINSKEIDNIQKEKKEIEQFIQNSHIRLDSLRIIWKRPV